MWSYFFNLNKTSSKMYGIYLYFQHFESVSGCCGQWDWAKTVIVCRRVFRVHGDLSPPVELLMVFSGFILTEAKKFIAHTICRDTFLIRHIYTGSNKLSLNRLKDREIEKSETLDISGKRYRVAGYDAVILVLTKRIQIIGPNRREWLITRFRTKSNSCHSLSADVEINVGKINPEGDPLHIHW